MIRGKIGRTIARGGGFLWEKAVLLPQNRPGKMRRAACGGYDTKALFKKTAQQSCREKRSHEKG